MTVKDLIEVLREYDEDTEVVIFRGQGDTQLVEEDRILYDELNNELILT